MERDPRYQHQPWYVRRWRDRHLLRVPYEALRCWLYGRVHADDGTPHRLRFGDAWSLARGMADVRRNWVWRQDELEALKS